MNVKIILVALAIGFPTSPNAQPAVASPSCPADLVVPPSWTAWVKPQEGKAGYARDDAKALQLGSALEAKLQSIGQVQFAIAPAKPIVASSFGGTFRLNLARATRVGIALSGPAWVDVLTGDTVAATIEHGHGPDCSGIRKIVWFDLGKGTHLVQIANAPAATIRIMAMEKIAR